MAVVKEGWRSDFWLMHDIGSLGQQTACGLLKPWHTCETLWHGAWTWRISPMPVQKVQVRYVSMQKPCPYGARYCYAMLEAPTQVCRARSSAAELFQHRSKTSTAVRFDSTVSAAQSRNKTTLAAHLLDGEKTCSGLACVSQCLIQIPRCIYYRIIE